jgi:hypothetical protein
LEASGDAGLVEVLQAEAPDSRSGVVNTHSLPDCPLLERLVDSAFVSALFSCDASAAAPSNFSV